MSSDPPTAADDRGRLFEPDGAPVPPPDWLQKETSSLGLRFEPSDVERLGQFLAYLLSANEKINLTAVRDPDDAWRKLILDALSLLPLIEELRHDGADEAPNRPVRVIDIGSGGGLPALPLAIVCPDVEFTLVEATGKKARFLEMVTRTMGLANTRVLPGRAERLAHDRSLRSAFDGATVRAVGHLAQIAELTLPFLRLGGLMLAVKGERAEQELEEAATAIQTLGGAHIGSHQTPGGTVVIVEKIGDTPRTYPRREGEPKRRPIGLRRDGEPEG